MSDLIILVMTNYARISIGCIRALYPVVMLMPLSVYQHGRMPLCETQIPPRVCKAVGGTEWISDQFFPEALHDEAVTVGMLVVGGRTASHGHDQVIDAIPCSCNHAV
jgi:hypothetical protein